MPVYPALSNYIEHELAAIKKDVVTIIQYSSVSGGGINQAYCLHTTAGKLMLKLNSRTAYPDMFRLEQQGLQTIGATQSIAVPQVIAQNEYEDTSFLVLEWIETGSTSPASSTLLGQQLASLHKHTAASFGFEHDNYMGSLPQSNRLHQKWCDFFVQERLQPMVKLGLNKGLLSVADGNDFEKLYQRLLHLFSEERPALLHGDLWSGNYLICSLGKPYLIDPAVSYGHREFDIAMTTLFGGFSREFYQAYHEAFPLNAGWQQRMHLWNLYPLLLHLNLFGIGYLGQVRAALQRYL